jgi:hypothetical protein
MTKPVSILEAEFAQQFELRLAKYELKEELALFTQQNSLTQSIVDDIIRAKFDKNVDTFTQLYKIYPFNEIPFFSCCRVNYDKNRSESSYMKVASVYNSDAKIFDVIFLMIGGKSFSGGNYLTGFRKDQELQLKGIILHELTNAYEDFMIQRKDTRLTNLWNDVKLEKTDVDPLRFCNDLLCDFDDITIMRDISVSGIDIVKSYKDAFDEFEKSDIVKKQKRLWNILKTESYFTREFVDDYNGIKRTNFSYDELHRNLIIEFEQMMKKLYRLAANCWFDWLERNKTFDTVVEFKLQKRFKNV